MDSADKSLKKSNQQRLEDLDWDNRGPGQVVEKFGDDGKVIGGTTWRIEIGWIATNFARVMRKLDEAIGILKKIATSQGVIIDYDELAKAIVDEQGKRLSAQTIELPELPK